MNQEINILFALSNVNDYRPIVVGKKVPASNTNLTEILLTAEIFNCSIHVNVFSA